MGFGGFAALTGVIIMAFVLALPGKDHYAEIGASGTLFTIMALYLSVRGGIRDRDRLLLFLSIPFGIMSVAWLLVGWLIRNA